MTVFYVSKYIRELGLLILVILTCNANIKELTMQADLHRHINQQDKFMYSVLLFIILLIVQFKIIQEFSYRRLYNLKFSFVRSSCTK